jgi:hypothetical protein
MRIVAIIFSVLLFSIAGCSFNSKEEVTVKVNQDSLIILSIREKVAINPNSEIWYEAENNRVTLLRISALTP